MHKMSSIAALGALCRPVLLGLFASVLPLAYTPLRLHRDDDDDWTEILYNYSYLQRIR